MVKQQYNCFQLLVAFRVKSGIESWTGLNNSSLCSYFTSKIIPGTTNQMSIGGNFSFKFFFEIGMGYKNIDYS
jgi:hypothetical protein